MEEGRLPRLAMLIVFVIVGPKIDRSPPTSVVGISASEHFMLMVVGYSTAWLVRSWTQEGETQNGAVFGRMLMWHQEAVLVALQTTGLVYMSVTDNTRNKNWQGSFFPTFFSGSGGQGSSVWIQHTFQSLVHRELVSSYTFFLLWYNTKVYLIFISSSWPESS